MKALNLAAGVAVLLAVGTARPAAPPTSGPIGIWAVSSTAKVPPGPWPFRYDGESVHVFMFDLHRENPTDCVYRLEARWEGDTLCLLWEGGWIPLARFVNGRFLVKEGGIVWSLQKVSKANWSERERILAKDRDLWVDLWEAIAVPMKCESRNTR
jgi:hypothetical protein